jgi:putative phosphoesterase
LKILIIADLHGNAEAVAALPQQYDQLWVLGDLVNYGPNPREIIDFVRSHADVAVRGNHDHAIGFNTDPCCSEPYKSMAAETGRFTKTVLTEDEKAYLRSLPLSATSEVNRSHFYLCHATPTDPLFAYCPPDSEQWQQEANLVSPGYLLVGHTHLQFQIDAGGRRVVNPGSVGQAKIGSPLACFAVFEDGKASLHSVPYDYEKTIEKIRHLSLSVEVEAGLVSVLQNGLLP